MRVVLSAVAISLALAAPAALADDDIAARVEAARAPITEWPGPEESPPMMKDKLVYVVTCTSQGIGCVRVGNGVADAGSHAGWTVRVIDGKADPATWNQAIQSAVAAGADGIVLSAVPPALVGDALEKAKEAGIAVVSAFNPYIEGEPVQAYVRPEHFEQGKLMADWVINDSGGKAKVVLMEIRQFPEIAQRVDGFKEGLKKCGGCSVAASFDQSVATMVQRLPGQIATLINRDQEINYVVLPVDHAAFLAIAGVRQARAEGKVKVAAYEGAPQELESIRAGEQAVTLAGPNEWMGWMVADELNRVWHGLEPLNMPVRYRLLDGENVPDTEGYKGDFDYQSKYLSLWGLK